MTVYKNYILIVCMNIVYLLFKLGMPGVLIGGVLGNKEQTFEASSRKTGPIDLMVIF